MAGRAAGITSSWVVLLAVTLMAARSASAEAPSQIDIVKATQNPLTRDLGSLAFENTFSFGLSPDDEFGYTLIIKPSLPVILSEHWSLINLGTLPVLVEPSSVRGGSRIRGLGDLQHTTLLSPTTTRRVVWGLGPTFGFRTATNDRLGTEKWLVGPTAIFVVKPERSVLGLTVKNLWSVAGNPARSKVNLFFLGPVLNINFDQGWFITSKPGISANWKATRGERWLVPVGGGIGKVFRVGKLGLSVESEFFAYPVRPTAGPSWSVGLELKVLFRRGQLRERIRDQKGGTPAGLIPTSERLASYRNR